MVWVKLEDGYPRNRKVAALSDAAFRLDVSAICWSNATGADGRILPHELTEIRAKATFRHVAELLDRGRWHVAGTPCDHTETCPPSSAEGGGWVIHDIWDQQPSAAKVEADRKAKAARQKKWLDSKKGTPRDAPRDASQDASGDGQKDAAPSPPRPAPKEAGAGTPPKPPPAAVDLEAIAARQRRDQAEQARRMAALEATRNAGAERARAALSRQLGARARALGKAARGA